MVYVPGNDHGVVLLVGRSSCPHCQDTKKLLANLSVGYYWVDLDRLDEANTTQVIGAVSFCGQVNAVPILVINNKPPCIIGYQEDAIRRAFA
jgi:glutaredoxin